MKALIEKKPIVETLREMEVGDQTQFPITQRNSVRNSLVDLRLEYKLKGQEVKFKGERKENDTIWLVTRTM